MEKPVKMRKGNISIQVVFYIMMMFLMIAIIVFGIQKLFLVQETLSQTERLELENKMQEAFEYCEDPLNKGNVKVYRFDNPRFNSVCMLVEGSEATEDDSLNAELEVIREAGDNIVLLSTVFSNGEIMDYQIVDSFYAEMSIAESSCQFDSENQGYVDYRISCS